MSTGDAKIAQARPAADRVMDRVIVDADGCWIWPGATAGRLEHISDAERERRRQSAYLLNVRVGT